jgi:hypothetical protein
MGSQRKRIERFGGCGMSEVKTRQTPEQVFSGSQTVSNGYWLCYKDGWDAALANVIMPEMMTEEQLRKFLEEFFAGEVGPMVPGALAKKLTGKLPVHEPVPSDGSLDWEAVEKIIAPLMTKQQYDMNDFEGVRHSSVIAKHVAEMIAATEAEVRREMEGEVPALRRLLESETERIGRDLMRWKTRAEEAEKELTAKPTGIEIPQVSEWPEDADFVELRYGQGPCQNGHWLIRTVYRPQPQKLTTSEQWGYLNKLVNALGDIPIHDMTDEQKVKIEAMCKAAGIPTGRSE